jgi:hypothetical protein
MIRWKTLRLY